MSQKEFFEELSAPLKNVRWSWGSVRESDKTVFLRVWQDGTIKKDNKRFIWISDKSAPQGDNGSAERLKHVGLVLSGYACYLVMCQAQDTKVFPRVVQSFNRKEVFLTGEVILDEGHYWIEQRERISVKKI